MGNLVWDASALPHNAAEVQWSGESRDKIISIEVKMRAWEAVGREEANRK